MARWLLLVLAWRDFYPRPPRGGRHGTSRRRYYMIIISIHALREEGDDLPGVLPDEDKKFLSTPSARRATPSHQRRQDMDKISIHALREEGDGRSHSCGPHLFDFYPRPPRGGRRSVPGRGAHYGKFLSTPSARRATRPLRPVWPRRGISIHALREEGDPPGPARTTPMSYFYPRPPRGGRR